MQCHLPATRGWSWQPPVGSDGALRIADEADGGGVWQSATEAALARGAKLEAELSKR